MGSEMSFGSNGMSEGFAGGVCVAAAFAFASASASAAVAAIAAAFLAASSSSVGGVRVAVTSCF